MLAQLPPELCYIIFLFACTDTGTTGRSLSLVSRYIRATSAAYKLQSIALFGRTQLADFATLLDNTPAHLRNTRFLYLNGNETAAELAAMRNDKLQELEDAQAALAAVRGRISAGDSEPVDKRAEGIALEEVRRAFLCGHAQLQEAQRGAAELAFRVLQLLAPSLEVLDITLSTFAAGRLVELDTTPMANLVNLTSSCGFPLVSGRTMPELYPQLTHLHVIASEHQWNLTSEYLAATSGITTFAPRLTHLRLSSVEQGEANLVNDLEAALQPMAKGNLLPRTLQQLVLQLKAHIHCEDEACVDAQTYRQLVAQARQLRDRDAHFFLLEPDEESSPAADRYLGEWLDVAGGISRAWNIAHIVDTN
ncbi:hypothetical protein MKEN_01098800 [Mycena kentingensis (nom. inval.)]|nr:hypothetical protein MKEN_01098800 [Mycena kentingensis (nom. inval.)]